jgi:pimeloyl-ACP methyl ester carboxylesterase
MARRIFATLASLLLLISVAAVRAEDEFFDSDGVKIHYIVEGQGEPVLLIHGFTGNIQMQWGLPGIIRALASDYQVIALDNRGHGRSGKPHDPQQYGVHMVDDAVRLLDHLNIKKAHVVGYSMGGFITGKLIADHPDRLITATMGGAGWSQANDKRLGFLKDLAESLDEGKGIGPLVAALTPANRPKPTEGQIKAINQMLMLTNDEKALAAVIRGMKDLSVPEAKLKANLVPTLALIGEIDPLKVGVDEMATRMSHLTVEVIKGADHMTAFARPEFVGGLKSFLASHATAKAEKRAPVAAGSR